MRNLTILATAIALGACDGDNGTANEAAANRAGPVNAAAPADNALASAATQAGPAAGPLPANFPARDLAARGADCIVYLDLAREAGANPGGDGPVVEQAAGRWQAALRTDGHLSVTEIQQLVGSTVNTLIDLPADRRDAAAAWCVEHAPQPAPARQPLPQTKN